MRKLTLFIALLLPATVAYANPSSPFYPFDWVWGSIYYGGCFGPEVLLVVTILLFYHMDVFPVMVALFAGNILGYFFVFLPILEETGNVFASEMIIVCVEAVFIKLLSLFERFQMDDFKRLGWITAFVVAAIGNYVSYYAGVMIAGG